MLSCTSSRTRTYGLLLRRHFPNVAWRRPVWPDVGPGHSENGWTWPGVAPCRWSLAPIEPGLPDDAAERLAPLIGRRTALAAAGVPQASTFCQLFFRWYNHEHRHSGIGYHTPHDVHYGYASAIRAGRARRPRFRPRANPEQFARKHPSRPPARSGLDQQTGRPIEPDPVIHLSSCLNKVDRFRLDVGQSRAAPQLHRRAGQRHRRRVTMFKSAAAAGGENSELACVDAFRCRIEQVTSRPGHQRRAGYAGSVQDMAQPGDVSRQGVSCRGGRPFRPQIVHQRTVGTSCPACRARSATRPAAGVRRAETQSRPRRLRLPRAA